MSGNDAELEQLRAVSCPALLEWLPPPWQLDMAESTRGCLTYRQGKGQIILVTHESRCWWNPGSTTARGDMFHLVQHLSPGTNFGQIRKLLREFVDISPNYPAHERTREREAPPVPVLERLTKRRAIWRDSPAWTNLTEVRRLPSVVVIAAIRREQVKEGPHASAWFAHRDHEGRLTGIELGGPDYRGFSTSGDKTLFRLPGAPVGSRLPVTRLAVAEAPIDAMSLAAIEKLLTNTPYIIKIGGMGPHTRKALDQLLRSIAGHPRALAVTAFDADLEGERHAGFLAEMAAKAGVLSERLTPPDGWND